ncbi:S41 family peptidase [Loigolactobacillus rennini]|uniref:Carboxy-terminal processing proteinase n=1 Tax=Loigolactobacillus rennini DSM 20253 TaxID=1423796 RepID=A0A0R2DFP6_9LACO|nr:S41 family peptidase [Loigolactobacillus rennini]KRM98924.1 carboxy-terminal processing proteinase [Loigolactobacillus rennini DSM 20253]
MQKNQNQTPQKKAQRKHRVSLVVYLTSTLLAFLVGIFITVLVMGLKGATTANSTDFNQLNQVYQAISQQYYRKPDQKKLVTGAIKGMVSSLDDPYSEYLSGKQAAALDNTVSGSFEGIGAEIQKKGHYIQIISPMVNSPAKKAGLKANDVITAINQQSTANWSITKASQKMRGPKDTKVTLTIKRGQNQFKVAVKRDVIPVKTVNAKLDKKHPTIGKIQITSFAEPTFKETKQAVKKLRRQGAKSFVLDVRSNPGGIMQQALKMSSMFVANGKPLMQVQPRTGKATVYRASKKLDGGFKVKEPVKVLIDGGSASAAEIFAAALHQSANIDLVGTNSFGKGTVQQVVSLDKKSEFKLTVAKWLTPQGDWINKKGLTPTTKAKYPSYAYLPLVNNQKTYQMGDVSKQVATLQKELKALAHDPGSTNGYFDQQTQQAVQAFQREHQLTQSGKLDPTTIQQLQTSLAAKIEQHDNAYQQAVTQLSQK